MAIINGVYDIDNDQTKYLCDVYEHMLLYTV